jgi:hypothetical protein
MSRHPGVRTTPGTRRPNAHVLAARNHASYECGSPKDRELRDRTNADLSSIGQWAAAHRTRRGTLILFLVVQFVLVGALLYGLRRIRPPQVVHRSSRARLLLAVGIDLVVVSVIAATLRLIILPQGSPWR